jgi:lipoprotein-anchoring transpeptidase ErfK/SrfK
MLRMVVIAAGAAFALVLLAGAPASAQLAWDWGGGNVVGDSGREVVRFSAQFTPGQIIVSFADRRLYFIISRGEALSYPIAVPREEDRWEGVTSVSDKKINPSWTPTAAMLAENPNLPPWIPGGHPMNPLGVRALYLGASFYRIHGTDAPWTIGTSVSKGCIRMYNRDMLDLYPRVASDAIVVVTWHRFGILPPATEQTARERSGEARGAPMSTLGYPDAPAQFSGQAPPAQRWDCQRSPPDGRMVCHPITSYGNR